MSDRLVRRSRTSLALLSANANLHVRVKVYAIVNATHSTHLAPEVALWDETWDRTACAVEGLACASVRALGNLPASVVVVQSERQTELGDLATEISNR